jgi:CBS domain-containing protein
MDKPISEMMTKSVWTALDNDTVEKVGELMARHHLSSVPVVDGKGAIFGIISNADLLRFRDARGNPKAARAWELCSFRPVEAGPATPARQVARMMAQHKVHHVVITEDHKVIGFVSALDFVEQFLLNERSR